MEVNVEFFYHWCKITSLGVTELAILPQSVVLTRRKKWIFNRANQRNPVVAKHFIDVPVLSRDVKGLDL